MAALGTVEFWDSFHGREVEGPTEWYLPLDVVVHEVLRVYSALKASLRAERGRPHGRGLQQQQRGGGRDARISPRVLHPGCGSSTLGVVLQRDHGCEVVNSDFSEGVLDVMRARYPGFDFVPSDARSSAFPDGSFDLTVDKGLFDSVTAGTHGRKETARAFLGEAARVLSAGGKYMLFSAFSNDGLGHKDMAEMLSHSGFGEGVEIRVLDTPPLEYPDQTSSYLYILTKGGSACSERETQGGAPTAPV